jgi:hypothetical protein
MYVYAWLKETKTKGKRNTIKETQEMMERTAKNKKADKPFSLGH